jgi:integrase
MYKLYRRKGSKVWQFRINRTRVRRSTRTEVRHLAEDYAKKSAEAYFKIKKLGEKPRKLWQEAATKWLKGRLGNASIHQDKISLRWLDSTLRGKYLDEINDEVIEGIKEKSQGVSNATTNKRLQVVGSIIRAEKISCSIALLPEPKKRVRWLTKDEAERLILALPPHLADMTKFTLATGLRMSNVTQLEWSQIDLDRRSAWIHPDQAKARKAISVPLNADAVLVLRKQTEPKHEPRVTWLPHPKYVFTFRGLPVKRVQLKTLRNALKKASIDNFRWHDLRHTWASWHVQNGTPTDIVRELGGWEDSRMVQRYAHLNPGHLAGYAENLCRPKLVHKTEHSQNQEEDKSKVSR